MGALRLYDFKRSGNGYKIRLLLHQLGRAYEKVEIDIRRKENRTQEFLKKNPSGRVPVLEIEDGRLLPESNAIIYYLSTGSRFLPADTYARAQVLGWLFFEQNNLEPNIANNRYWMTVLGKPDEYKDEIQRRLEPGYDALMRMETHLEGRKFFVDDQYSIADIGLYAYSHVAHEGGFDLKKFPRVRAWQESVRQVENHIPMNHD